MSSAISRNLPLDREVDAVLCPGGFWEDETVVPEVVSTILDEVAALAPTPVFVAPELSTHTTGSASMTRFTTSARRGRQLPRNFEVFSNRFRAADRCHPAARGFFTAWLFAVLPDSAVPMPIVKRPDAVNVAILPQRNCRRPDLIFAHVRLTPRFPYSGKRIGTPQAQDLRSCGQRRRSLTVEELTCGRAIHAIDLEMDSPT